MKLWVLRKWAVRGRCERYAWRRREGEEGGRESGSDHMALSEKKGKERKRKELGDSCLMLEVRMGLGHLMREGQSQGIRRGGRRRRVV